MTTIEVKRWVDPKDSDNLDKIHVGDVLVDASGIVALEPHDISDPSFPGLDRAVTDIRALDSLPEKISEQRELEGAPLLVHKQIAVVPGDALYPRAVAGYLMSQHGFLCTLRAS